MANKMLEGCQDRTVLDGKDKIRQIANHDQDTALLAKLH
jgi:hypothetical protein